MSDSLRPHGLQHARLLCSPLSARVYSNSCPLSRSMLSNHLILCRPPLLLPSIFPSTRVFSKELALCIRWPKYWRFSFSISPPNEYSRLISFRTDWFEIKPVSPKGNQQPKGLSRVFSSITIGNYTKTKNLDKHSIEEKCSPAQLPPR